LAKQSGHTDRFVEDGPEVDLVLEYLAIAIQIDARVVGIQASAGGTIS
jgi:hypothetical protein